MAERCECCDLLIGSCGKSADAKQRAARARDVAALKAVGWIIAEWPGHCHGCQEWYPAGTLIHRYPLGIGWIGECCAERITGR